MRLEAITESDHGLVEKKARPTTVAAFAYVRAPQQRTSKRQRCQSVPGSSEETEIQLRTDAKASFWFRP
jgi:hypothetical protein